ncbi:MAG: hypothetical protein WAT12_04385 [Candidatus Nitrotoga sp.]
MWRAVQTNSVGTLGAITHPSNIGCDRIELPIQNFGSNWQIVFVVSCVDEFTLPYWLQACLAQQVAHPIATNLNTLRFPMRGLDDGCHSMDDWP